MASLFSSLQLSILSFFSAFFNSWNFGRKSFLPYCCSSGSSGKAENRPLTARSLGYTGRAASSYRSDRASSGWYQFSHNPQPPENNAIYQEKIFYLETELKYMNEQFQMLKNRQLQAQNAAQPMPAEMRSQPQMNSPQQSFGQYPPISGHYSRKPESPNPAGQYPPPSAIVRPFSFFRVCNKSFSKFRRSISVCFM